MKPTKYECWGVSGSFEVFRGHSLRPPGFSGSLKQIVFSMQLMQGWYAFMPDPYEEREVVWRRWLFPEGFCRAVEVSGSV